MKFVVFLNFSCDVIINDLGFVLLRHVPMYVYFFSCLLPDAYTTTEKNPECKFRRLLSLAL